MASLIEELFVEIEANANEFNEVIDGVAKKLESTSSDMDKIAKAMSVSLTAPITAIGALALEAGEKVEQAMITIERRTGETGEALNGLEESFKTVYKSVTDSSQDIAAAMALITQRTGDTGEALEAVTVSLSRLAKYTGSDFKTTVDGAVQMFAQWKVATEDQVGALDMLYAASQKAGLPASQLIQTLNQFGPVFRQLGLDMQQSVAMIGAFTQAGLNFDSVAAGLKRSLGEAAKAGQDAGQVFKDSVAAIQLADEATGKLIAQNLVGTRSFAAFYDAVKSGTLNIDAFAASLDNSDGKLKQMGQDTQTLEKIWESFKREIEIAVAPIGQDIIENFKGFLNDEVKPLVLEIASLADAFLKLPQGTQRAVEGVAAVVAVIGPAVIVIDKFAGALKGLFETELIGGGAEMAVTSIKSIAFAITNDMMGALSVLELGLVAISSAVAVVAAAFAGWDLGAWAAKNIPGFQDFVNKVIDGLDKMSPELALLDLALKKLAESAGKAFAPDATVNLDAQVKALANAEIYIDKASMSQTQYAAAVALAVKNLSDQKSGLDGVTTSTKQAATATDDLAKAQAAGYATVKAWQDAIAAGQAKLAAQADAAWWKNTTDGLKILQMGMKDFATTVDGAAVKTDLFIQGLEALDDKLNKFGTIKPPDIMPLLQAQNQLNTAIDAYQAGLGDIVIKTDQWGQKVELVKGKWVDLDNQILATSTDPIDRMWASLDKVMNAINGVGSALGPMLDGQTQKFDALSISMAKVEVSAKNVADSFKSEGVIPTQQYVDQANAAKAAFDNVYKAFQEQQQGIRTDTNITTNDLIAMWVDYEQKREAAAIQSGQTISDADRKLLQTDQAYLAGLATQTKTVYDGFAENQKQFNNDIKQAFSGLSSGVASAIVDAKGLGDAFEKVAQDIEKAIIKYIINDALTALRKSLTDTSTQVGGLQGDFQKLAKSISDLFGGGTKKAVPSIPGVPTGGGTGGPSLDNGGLNSAPYDPVTNPGGGVGGFDADGVATSAAGGSGSDGMLSGVTDALGGVAAAVGIAIQVIEGIVQGLQMARLIDLTGEIEVTTRSTFNQVFSIQGTLNQWLPYLQGIQDNIGDLTKAFVGGRDDGEGMNMVDAMNAITATIEQLVGMFGIASSSVGGGAGNANSASFSFPDSDQTNSYLWEIANNAILIGNVVSGPMLIAATASQALLQQISTNTMVGGSGGTLRALTIIVPPNDPDGPKLAEAIVKALADVGLKFS